MARPRRRVAARLRRAVVAAWAVARATIAQAWADRVLGLAAEAAFWALLSATPLLLVLVAAVGYLTPLFGPGIVIQVEHTILTAAEQVLAPTAVQDLLKPLLADVLRHGRGGVISLGFLLALWAGSTAMSIYVNAITLAYGMRDVRSVPRTRLLAFGLYLGAVLVGTLTLPLLVAAPEWISAAAPEAAQLVVDPIVAYGYWPTVVVLCTGLLVLLYHLAVPARGRWRRDLPGAITAMLGWLAGSYLLRTFLTFAVTHSPIYGALSAPVAALLFLYLTALAVLFGAELNAQLDRRHPTPATAAARAEATRLLHRRTQP